MSSPLHPVQFILVLSARLHLAALPAKRDLAEAPRESSRSHENEQPPATVLLGLAWDRAGPQAWSAGTWGMWCGRLPNGCRELFMLACKRFLGLALVPSTETPLATRAPRHWPVFHGRYLGGPLFKMRC